MKKFIIVFTIIFFSCDNMKKNKLTDINPNELEYVDLIGEFSRKDLSHILYSSWFDKNYESYIVDEESADKIKEYITRDLKIKVIMGTWCSDSRENVPSFFKLMDYLNIKKRNIDLIGLDLNKENPNGDEKTYEIINVPTFIFYKENIEINRIVEITLESFEKDIAFWLYSSGSTGSPKGTLHMHKSLIETASNYAKEILKINKHDICFSAAKLFFAYGLGNALTFPMSVGATSILMSDRPTPESVSHIIQKNAVTLFFGVPTLYAALLNSKISHSLFKSLRLSVSAGEALPANLYEKWYNFLGIKVLDGIGSTEMLHIFISNTIDNITPGASGKPVPGYEARLINDDGSIASDNQIAELEINGPSSAVSYWNKPEKSKVTFKAEWTRTGDKYIRDTRGIYTYCGRADDMMKVSGQYVSPFEVEAALQTHDEVLEAAVVAKKDKDNLIKPKAFIILKNQCNDEEILKTKLTNHVKKQLTPFKYPRWYEFVEVLPKTATGKIQRYKLRTNDD